MHSVCGRNHVPRVIGSIVVLLTVMASIPPDHLTELCFYITISATIIIPLVSNAIEQFPENSRPRLMYIWPNAAIIINVHGFSQL